MRFLLRGSQRDSQIDVHDPDERYTFGQADNRRTDKSISTGKGSGYGRFVELSREETNQAIQASRARRAGRHLADGAIGHRSRAGIPKMYRMLFMSGCLSRFARPSVARKVHRSAVFGSRGGPGDAPAG